MTAPDLRGNVEFLLQRGRRPYMALFHRSPRCNDSVHSLRYLCRADECAGMPQTDPKQSLAREPLLRCSTAQRTDILAMARTGCDRRQNEGKID
jgi:hypothetical protein